MASERLSRALMSMGEDLGRMAEVSLTRERDRADRIHRASLARLAENRADARQERSIEARAAEAKAGRKLTISENEKTRALETERLSARDRRAIEAEAQGLLADNDARMIELRDKLMEFKVEGLGTIDPAVEQQIMQEMQSLRDARSRIRYTMIEQLAAMDDPRYAGLDQDARLAAAGYTPEEIEVFKSQATGGGGDKGGKDTDIPAPTSSLTPEQRQRRTAIWAENPDLSYAEVEALAAQQKPNPDDAEAVIERPKKNRGRRRRRALALPLSPYGTVGGDEAREGRLFETLYEDLFAEPARESRRRLMEDNFERRGKGSP